MPSRRHNPPAIPEWKLQAAMIAEFHKLEAEGWPLTVAGDQNAAKRGWAAQAIAKATGMTPGEPDVRVYFGGGKLVLLELKRVNGKTSAVQDDRHARLSELGFDVTVCYLGNEIEARELAREIASMYARAPHRYLAA